MKVASPPPDRAMEQDGHRDHGSQPILETFWALADINPTRRVQAAKELVASLKAAQALTPDAQEMAYCLKRLVRGLASSREGARQGFAMALTEVRTLPVASGALPLAYPNTRCCTPSLLCPSPPSWT